MTVDEHSGRALSRLDAVRQAVHRVVRTRLGTRPMTPAFGTDHMALAALPMSPVGTARLAGEVAKAVATWEPRATVERTRFDGTMQGQVSALITAHADGVPFEVDLRSGETLAEMRLRPTYLWEPGATWVPTIGDPSAVSADSASRVIDGVTPVELTGLDFGLGVSWTIAIEADSAISAEDLLSIPGVLVSAFDGDTTCAGIPGTFGPLDDYAGDVAEKDYLSGLDEFPPAWFFLSHNGAGRLTVGLGEVATIRQASAPLPAASSLVLGPLAMTVTRLAYWRRELTARERIAFFRELQRG